jgi:hypothetical protein
MRPAARAFRTAKGANTGPALMLGLINLKFTSLPGERGVPLTDHRTVFGIHR